MTKAEQARITAWRLRILKWAERESRQVARACRYFGISRTAYYRWKQRYDELGEAGLADRPRTPHRSPRATPPAVISKILYLRQNYHFGAGRISAYLQRFHEVKIACSSVHRILVKHDMGRLPANQKHQPHRKRWKRYDKACARITLPIAIAIAAVSGIVGNSVRKDQVCREGPSASGNVAIVFFLPPEKRCAVSRRDYSLLR